MKVEQAKQIVSKAIEELSQSLERGHSETLRNYLAAIGRFHRYSLRNVMLIASQNPAATHVAGFHTWHKLGRFVKKGEKGILILAPIVRATHGYPSFALRLLDSDFADDLSRSPFVVAPRLLRPGV